MDSYIAITLFGCFCAGLYWCAHFVLNRYCHCSFNAFDVSTDIAAITVSQRLANGLDNFALLAIPFHLCRNADEQRRYCDTFD